MTDASKKDSAKGEKSFCVPRLAIEALLDASATAYEICAYLILANFSDSTGCFSTAGSSAVGRYTGGNKSISGPVKRALENLKKIRAKRKVSFSNGRGVDMHGMADEWQDLGPLVLSREQWLKENVGTEKKLPDGPIERSKVLHILSDFGEPLDERVWIGSNLIFGINTFNLPLRKLKNNGDVAARLLLLLYGSNDMATWGGLSPVGLNPSPWMRYKTICEDDELEGGFRLIRAKAHRLVITDWTHLIRAWPQPVAPKHWVTLHKEAGNPIGNAFFLLQAEGYFYEMVMVLNRNAVNVPKNDDLYIPEDAEPFYELDSRSQHGYKSRGEEGVGGLTARTVGELGFPVALPSGKFDATYAAIVKKGQGAMIAGIYRMRFRVVNPENSGVKETWRNIQKNQEDAFKLIQDLRASNNLKLN